MPSTVVPACFNWIQLLVELEFHENSLGWPLFQLPCRLANTPQAGTYATRTRTTLLSMCVCVCVCVLMYQIAITQHGNPHTHACKLQTNCVRESQDLFPTYFLFVSQYYRYMQCFLNIFYLSIYIFFVLFALLYACWLAHFFTALFHGNMINFHKLVKRSKSASGASSWEKQKKQSPGGGVKCVRSPAYWKLWIVLPSQRERERDSNERRRAPKAIHKSNRDMFMNVHMSV